MTTIGHLTQRHGPGFPFLGGSQDQSGATA